MCGCEGNWYQVGDFDNLQVAGKILLTTPALQWLCIAVLTAAFLVTEFVCWQSNRQALRERYAYERQETVFYKSEQDKHLLRPVSKEDVAGRQLLRPDQG